jgi:glycosyltransferase involved in cell wall biosynthesis
MSSGPKLTVVVPFLNEAENLPVLFQRLCKVMEGRPEVLEVLFVDDGSTDGSPDWVVETAKKDSRARLLQLSRNFGHQIAITAGLDHAEGDAAVIIDADLQDPPELIPELLAKWREGYEVVYAVRRSRQGETWIKKFLAATFYRVFRTLAKVDVPMDAGDFRLVDRKVIDALKQVRELHRFMRGLTCWVGYKQVAVHYDRAARHAGETKYPVWKSARLAWDALTSFSGAPLRWVVGMGGFACLVGLLWFAVILWGRIYHPAYQEKGWPSLMAAVIFMGGVQLISVGMLGQYVSRIFEEVKRRPLYYCRTPEGGTQGRP